MKHRRLMKLAFAGLAGAVGKSMVPAVELEHCEFERHGCGGVNMRDSVNQEGGWGALLGLFASRAENAK